jgi:thioredoxin reductase
MPGVIVVGAGACGLGAAIAHAETDEVMLVDRIPVAGGEAGYEHPDVRKTLAAALGAGVRFKLGATAIRWEQRRLLVCEPGAVRWYEASRLVFAGGVRPATIAELGLTGDRAAGVLPVTVARHLLEADPALWRHVVIIGSGCGAPHAAAMITSRGGSVTYVGEDPIAPRWATHSRCGSRAVAIVGRSRVTSLRLTHDGEPALIRCDAVLLAADPRPVRNVDGAIADDADGLLYVQDIPAETFTETVELAAAAARRSRVARARETA